MAAAPNRRLSVSTFSLHRALSVHYRDLPGDDEARPGTEAHGPAAISLLEVPRLIAERGFGMLEISHPHLPSRDSVYLGELRAAIAEAGVELLSLLVEAGDLSHPVHAARDEAWMARWIETAGQLGAQRARLIAGKAHATPDTLEAGAAALRRLARMGYDQGVRVTTENWFDLLSGPEAVCTLLQRLEGEVGFNLDFGNWGGPTKYADLAAIFSYAESCHAKCSFAAEYIPDAADYRRCLELAKESGFTGPFTLIYDGPGADEWRGLAIEQEIVLPYIGGAA